MLEQVQVITENEEAKFAVIPYSDYLQIRALLLDEEKLEDYLDYLHAQRAKDATQKWFSLEEIKADLEIE